MTKDEALRLALEAFEYIEHNYMSLPAPATKAITAIKAALEAKDEPWTQDDMAYRPNGLPQEFIKHEVELPEDWSQWVCPNPDEYFMKCCDCGLVHEVQYRVARYGEGDYCELVNDKDVQAQFRMRRRTPPQQEAKDEPVVWNEGVPAMLPKQKEGETFIVSYEPKLEAKDEPVAWMDASRFEELRNGFTVMTTLTKKKAFFDDIAIYTTLPQRKPLTDEEIDAIEFKALGSGPLASFRDYARRIEAAHQIYEDKK